MTEEELHAQAERRRRHPSYLGAHPLQRFHPLDERFVPCTVEIPHDWRIESSRTDRFALWGPRTPEGWSHVHYVDYHEGRIIHGPAGALLLTLVGTARRLGWPYAVWAPAYIETMPPPEQPFRPERRW
jgi:hypothetical protein